MLGWRKQDFQFPQANQSKTSRVKNLIKHIACLFHKFRIYFMISSYLSFFINMPVGHLRFIIITHINVYICKVGMPPSHPLIFSFDPHGMSKPLKSHALGLPEIKNQQRSKFDESCRVRLCICKASKNAEKGGDKPKKQNSYNRQ